MTISHDPNHSHSAGLVLSEGAEETAEASVAGKVPARQASRSSVGVWAWLVMVLPGMAAFGTGLIFFSFRPGLLALENMGAGLSLLVLSLLLVLGARGLIEAPAEEPIRGEAALEASVVSAPPAPPMSSAVAAPVLPEAPPDAPPSRPAPEGALVAPKEAAAAPAGSAPSPAPEAAEETSPAPGTPRKPARKAAKRAQGTVEQNGHAQAAEVPRLSAGRVGAGMPEDVPRPSLANLPERFHLSTIQAVIDEEADDLGDLLGRVAEQGALAMATRGQRGVQRRARLAEKLEAFQQEMARDQDYAPIARFLESMAALLRAGTPIPPVKPLEEPFDGLYQYVLTLVRRRM